MVAIRRGFGLVEVVVAMTLLTIGIMSVSAGAAFSSSVLRAAENVEDASRIAESALDSIAFASERVAGSRGNGRFTVRWIVDDGTVTVTVIQRESGAQVTSLTAVIPPVLDTVPCPTCTE